ncbi:uncharacterized protein [Taeniopygia guttata]|uniref:uncharacterized protein n=1 Tax=Taeniopygia guttata TaxID=59729 RepID=UPI003BB8FD0E
MLPGNADGRYLSFCPKPPRSPRTPRGHRGPAAGAAQGAAKHSLSPVDKGRSPPPPSRQKPQEPILDVAPRCRRALADGATAAGALDLPGRRHGAAAADPHRHPRNARAPTRNGGAGQPQEDSEGMGRQCAAVGSPSVPASASPRSPSSRAEAPRDAPRGSRAPQSLAARAMLTARGGSGAPQSLAARAMLTAPGSLTARGSLTAPGRPPPTLRTPRRPEAGAQRRTQRARSARPLAGPPRHCRCLPPVRGPRAAPLVGRETERTGHRARNARGTGLGTHGAPGSERTGHRARNAAGTELTGHQARISPGTGPPRRENLDQKIWGKYQCANIYRMKMTCLVELFNLTVSALDRIMEGLATHYQREC